MPEDIDIDTSGDPIRPSQWAVVTLIVACACGSVLYRWLFAHDPLEHTGLMFVGIPAVIAIILAMAPKTKTVTGGILRGITLALLIVAPLLGEGYLCILIASPLFYAIGIWVGKGLDREREEDRADDERRRARLSCIALLLLPMCLEGTIPELTIHRAQTVEVTETVNAREVAVEAALAHSPRIDTKLPLYLRIGFPRPLEAHGDGLEVGATRTVHFSGAEGDPPGDLVMRVQESREGYVRFVTTSDASKLTQWIRWESSEVEWRPIDATHTAVTWRIHFERRLDPAWYFTPWERSAVHEAAKYLIAVNAVPAEITQ